MFNKLLQGETLSRTFREAPDCGTLRCLLGSCSFRHTLPQG